MQASDVETLTSIRNSLLSTKTEEAVESALIMHPAQEVEASLASFLKHRLSKLQEAATFEDQIKDVLVARLSEATFPQLIGLLEVIQKNNNIATEKVLAPFIAQSGSKSVTETMREGARNAEHPEERVYSETNDKSILQSLGALSQFMELAKKSSQDRIVGNTLP